MMSTLRGSSSSARREIRLGVGGPRQLVEQDEAAIEVGLGSSRRGWAPPRYAPCAAPAAPAACRGRGRTTARAPAGNGGGTDGYPPTAMRGAAPGAPSAYRAAAPRPPGLRSAAAQLGQAPEQRRAPRRRAGAPPDPGGRRPTTADRRSAPTRRWPPAAAPPPRRRRRRRDPAPAPPATPSRRRRVAGGFFAQHRHVAQQLELSPRSTTWCTADDARRSDCSNRPVVSSRRAGASPDGAIGPIGGTPRTLARQRGQALRQRALGLAGRVEQLRALGQHREPIAPGERVARRRPARLAARAACRARAAGARAAGAAAAEPRADRPRDRAIEQRQRRRPDRRPAPAPRPDDRPA